MTKVQIERLKPFLAKLGARQRIILILLADDYNVPDLVVMDRRGLQQTQLPDEFEIYKEEVLDNAATDAAFTYPSGRTFLHTDFYRVVRQATARVLGQAHTLKDYKRYIKIGTL